MRVNKQDDIYLSTGGLSVVGIARKVLEVMEGLDTSYPSQYTLTVDPERQRATIRRNYQEDI